MNRRVILYFFLLLLSLPSVAAEQSPSALQQLLASGSLRIGVAIYPPWTMRAKDGALIGSEVDIGERLAADMGLQADFGVYQFDQLLPALQRGDIDIVIAGMGVTPARALQVNFSQPYGSFGIDLVTNSSLTREFAAVTALNDPKVKLAVVSGSAAVDVAKRLFPRASLKSYKDEQQVVRDLLDNQLHGYIESSPVPRFLALRYPQRLDRPLNQHLVHFRQAFAVAQGQPDLLAFLNAWVVAREADKWLQSTENYWFGSLQWQQLVP